MVLLKKPLFITLTIFACISAGRACLCLSDSYFSIEKMFCTGNDVFKASVGNWEEHNASGIWQGNLTVQSVYKGFSEEGDTLVWTQEGHSCDLSVYSEMVLFGSISDGEFTTSFCSPTKGWHEVSEEERMRLSEGFYLAQCTDSNRNE